LSIKKKGVNEIETKIKEKGNFLKKMGFTILRDI
jgi:hypothetical protein